MAKNVGGKKKKTSEHQKGLYLAYKTSFRAEKNKKLKLAKHLKRHPNDIQSAERREVSWLKQPVFATKLQWSRNYLNQFR